MLFDLEPIRETPATLAIASAYESDAADIWAPQLRDARVSVIFPQHISQFQTFGVEEGDDARLTLDHFEFAAFTNRLTARAYTVVKAMKGEPKAPEWEF